MTWFDPEPDRKCLPPAQDLLFHQVQPTISDTISIPPSIPTIVQLSMYYSTISDTIRTQTLLDSHYSTDLQKEHYTAIPSISIVPVND